MKWRADAPSNIALIKYMGKTNLQDNRPYNASLSYTLPNLISTVELEIANISHDTWQPLTQAISLSLPAQQRFLNHLKFLKQQLNLEQHFIVRSTNNFPADCGLASSASSFAALTLCAAKAVQDLQPNKPHLTPLALAHLSQKGSGSSCRSFFSPWALWDTELITVPDIPYSTLIHYTIIISQQIKKISSSLAHQRVVTSLLYPDRTQRASIRLKQLLTSLSAKDWLQSYHLVWQEFWDMHALFETAKTPFGYMQAESIAVLHNLRDYWQKTGDGPLITMDAGPNIHLLFRPEQDAIINEIKQNVLKDFLMV